MCYQDMVKKQDELELLYGGHQRFRVDNLLNKSKFPAYAFINPSSSIQRLDTHDDDESLVELQPEMYEFPEFKEDSDMKEMKEEMEKPVPPTVGNTESAIGPG